jgi:hypothetical protein
MDTLVKNSPGAVFPSAESKPASGMPWLIKVRTKLCYVRVQHPQPPPWLLDLGNPKSTRWSSLK